MDTSELYELAAAVAPLLDGNWKAVPADGNRCVWPALEWSEMAARIMVREDSGRVVLSGWLPDLPDYVRRNAVHLPSYEVPDITVAKSRPYAQVALALSRRLLPGYLAGLQRFRDMLATRLEQFEQQQDVIARLAGALGGNARIDRGNPTRATTDGHPEGVSWNGGGMSVRFEVSRFNATVSVTVGCDAVAAVLLAGLLPQLGV
jgi:hypothetical protein